MEHAYLLKVGKEAAHLFRDFLPVTGLYCGGLH